MTEEILTSIDWHFLAGNDALTGDQFAEHQERHACPDCEDLALAEPAAELAVSTA